MTSTGTPSACAEASPVRALVKPGPDVVNATAGLPVASACPMAMKTAFVSCVAFTTRMPGRFTSSA